MSRAVGRDVPCPEHDLRRKTGSLPDQNPLTLVTTGCLTFGARLEKSVVRDRVGAVRCLEVCSQTLGRLDRHFHAVLKHGHWENVGRVRRAPQAECDIRHVGMKAFRLQRFDRRGSEVNRRTQEYRWGIRIGPRLLQYDTYLLNNLAK